MFDNGGYPPGARYDTSAPYNEHVEPEKEFDVVCSQTLSKNFVVKTQNYRHCEDPSEDGVDIWDDTSDTVWNKEFKDNGYHTPLELISLFKEFLQNQSKKGHFFKSPAYTRMLIEDCENWEEDELIFYGDK